MCSHPIPVVFPKDLLLAGYSARWTVVWLNTAILTFVKLPCMHVGTLLESLVLTLN